MHYKHPNFYLQVLNPTISNQKNQQVDTASCFLHQKTQMKNRQVFSYDTAYYKILQWWKYMRIKKKKKKKFTAKEMYSCRISATLLEWTNPKPIPFTANVQLNKKDITIARFKHTHYLPLYGTTDLFLSVCLVRPVLHTLCFLITTTTVIYKQVYNVTAYSYGRSRGEKYILCP